MHIHTYVLYIRTCSSGSLVLCVYEFAGLYIHVYKIYRPDLMYIYHAHAYVQYIHNSSGSLVLQVSLQIYTYVKYATMISIIHP